MLRVATRASPLARWQAQLIIDLLGVPAELVVVSTEGDRNQEADLHEIGGQGVFVKDVQRAVLGHDADVAVHSAKDLPSAATEGLCLAAVPERGDASDALAGRPLADIPTGGRIGTGSVRRRAQLAAARPDLVFGPLRGNIETRLRKADEFDAVVVAAAALQRLDLQQHIAEVLDPAIVLPQVGQGALAVECRSDDAGTRALLSRIEHAPSRRAVDAERAFLADLGGGCDTPCGAHAVVDAAGEIELTAVIASLDGHVLLRTRRLGSDAGVVGRETASELLDDAGGRELLGVGA